MDQSRSPKVTIMIPTYNQESFIEEAVNSALMQTYPNLEVIVGDDASTDSTADIVSGIDDGRLTLIRNPCNLGRTKNYRNLLYNHASGDYVVNLDGDDYYTDPEFITAAVNLIGNDPNVVIVAARASWTSGKRKIISEIPKENELYGLSILKNLPRKKFFFKHMATLYKRDLALDLDFYRADLISSDWESLYRIALFGKVKYLNIIVGVWRIHEQNETKSMDFKKITENLEIWTTIYEEAKNHGMNSIVATIKEHRCISYFASMYAARLSLNGYGVYVKFLWYLMRRFKLGVLFLFCNPFYGLRIIAGFFGYYRMRTRNHVVAEENTCAE